jgi:hypothetical protein
MRLTTKMAFAALLLGSTFGMTTVAAYAATPGCPSATQKTEAEGGAGGGTQQAGVRKTEAEGGAGGGTQQYARKTEAEGGAGGGTQQAMAQPCK